MFIIIFALIVAAFVLIMGWRVSGWAIRPPQNSYPWSLSDFPGLSPEPVTFRSRDGLSLSGRFHSGSNGATIILSHGYGDNKDQMIPWADFLNQAGFNVFTYDMRSRGQSGGRAVTLGAKEQIDLRSAVDYLVSRSDVDPDSIGAFGLSLGGSVSILTAANDRRIKALVNDSGFSSASSIISTSYGKLFHLPSFPFAPVTVKMAEWRAGASVGDVQPVEVIGKISPRPILFIHGTEDSLVLPEYAEENFAAAGRPKEIWWVDGADHVEATMLQPQEYQRRITEFFGQALDVPVSVKKATASRIPHD